MRLKQPIQLTSLMPGTGTRSLRLDETESEYQPGNTERIAQAAMAKVNLLTNPTLTPEQKQVLYEVFMPELAGQQNGIQRNILPGGQVLDIVHDGRNQKQTYESSRHNGIQAAPVRREILNGHI